MRSSLIVFGLLLIFCFRFGRPLKQGDCAVCMSALEKIENAVDKLRDKGTIEELDDFVKNWCSKAKGKEEKFCYYIGGLATSATKMLRDLTMPLKNYIPSSKICERLKKSNPVICELKFDKPIDLTGDLNKLRIGDLKKVLLDWGEDCKGCLEKSEFVAKVKELLTQRAKSNSEL